MYICILCFFFVKKTAPIFLVTGGVLKKYTHTNLVGSPMRSGSSSSSRSAAAAVQCAAPPSPILPFI